MLHHHHHHRHPYRRHHHHHRSKLSTTTHLQPDNNKPQQQATSTVTVRDKKPRFFINDHVDILIEILKRLDGRSLCVAACVCRLWCTIARNDSLWEHLCFRHVSSPPPPSVRPVVVALGGYKRLYMVCLRPVLSRLAELTTESHRRVRRKMWSRDEVQLSLSLFCVDYYERLGECDASTSSLMFLCKPVNV